MLKLHKNYVLDENQNPYAVMIPIADFELIEKILEKYSMTKLMTDFGNMKKPSDTWLEECFELMDKAQGDSQGRRWTREELYDV
jgi:hypothetical protein